MTYHFEQLGDERFQQLCQAVLVAMLPNVQCLPVGLPDGGRDAFHSDKKNHGRHALTVFQVKYSTNPQTKKARDVIESLIKSESAKVKKLIKRGATSYYLLTNVSGTSHIDAGSIDRINKRLTDIFGIPSYCWWRDDISRRIDGLQNLKWSYPDILRAVDLLPSLINPEKDESENNRCNTIKAYIAYQIQQDSNLKFKQIELQKSIVDLFVDVPGKLIAPPGIKEESHQALWAKLIEDCEIKPLSSSNYNNINDNSVGIVELLSKDKFLKNVKRLVVEGAPGQGKSTVTQYLCQVHRLLLLNRSDELSKVNLRHRPLSARIPFRVDLRDYASWLAGRDPFTDANDARLPQHATPVLESFIAAQVHRYTGATFSVDDLVAIAKKSQILIVLDGFDEVADVRLREKIVSEVSDATSRLDENAISVQIIVTSRPAAFANSPGFPRDEWRHLQMLPLSRSVIEFYASKWLQSRALDRRESDIVLSVLRDKLKQAYVRDLARNPMQLAILLALISVQGASLPDRRTALYDNYIEIFLNRESEKSVIVRDHRDLLVQIHRFLAWKLQSEAEESGAGHVSEVRLKTIVRDFLDANGHSIELAEKLFGGMVERVVALVSRVQGTFEFEVQPLREYFAARHLYDTKPYSPAGSPPKGDLLQRFDAIGRNFYWLNVTRFYAGCYSSGELSSLIHGIDALRETEQFNCIGYTPQLSITLLNDFVFSQQPRLETAMAEKIVTHSTLLVHLAEGIFRHRGADVAISSPYARSVIAKFAMDEIRRMPPYDLLNALAGVVSANTEVSELHGFWKDIRTSFSDVADWLDLGSHLGVYAQMDITDALDLCRHTGTRAAYRLAISDRHDVFDKNPILWNELLDEVVSRNVLPVHMSREPSECTPGYDLVTKISILLWPYWLHELSLETPSENSIEELISRHFFSANRIKSKARPPVDDAYAAVHAALEHVLSASPFEFISDPSKWRVFLEICRKKWGDQWPLFLAAINYAQVSTSNAVSMINLDDASSMLCDRAICARNNAMNFSWWERQLFDVAPRSSNERAFSILCFLRWAPTSFVISNSISISDILDRMSVTEWHQVAREILYSDLPLSQKDKKDVLRKTDIPSGISPRLGALLRPRLTAQSQKQLWRACMADYTGTDTLIWHETAFAAVIEAIRDVKLWPEALKIVRTAYEHHAPIHFWEGSVPLKASSFPLHVAKTVCESPREYPLGLVGLASSVITKSAGAGAIPVVKISTRDEWAL